MQHRVWLSGFAACLFLAGLLAGHHLRTAFRNSSHLDSQLLQLASRSLAAAHQPTLPLPTPARSARPQPPQPDVPVISADLSADATGSHSTASPSVVAHTVSAAASTSAAASAFTNDGDAVASPQFAGGTDRPPLPAATEAPISGVPHGQVPGQPPFSDATWSRDISWSPDIHPPAVPLPAQSSSAASPDERTQSTLALVREFLPDMPSADAEVWAEELAGLDPQDACFILQQKQLARQSGPSAPPVWLTAELSSPHPAIPPSAASVSPYEAAIQIIQSNLAGSTVPGFRGQQVLSAGTQPAQYTALRRFDCGPQLFTGNPLHAALAPDPHLMFSVTDAEPGHNATATETSLVTRRGEFCVLPDNSLGLRLGSRAYRLLPGVQLPHGWQRVWITDDGTVQASTSTQSTTAVGRVAVVHVRELSALSTTDGVVFELPNAADASPAADNVRLTTESLELSNVNATDEWAALASFRRLWQEFPTLP